MELAQIKDRIDKALIPVSAGFGIHIDDRCCTDAEIKECEADMTELENAIKELLEYTKSLEED